MLEARRLGALLLVFMVFNFTGAMVAQPPGPTTVKLPDGTLLRLALLDNLSSATNNADDAVNLEVTEDVKVGDLVAIPKGSTARGHVVEAQPKRRMARGGKLAVNIDAVRLADGEKAALRGASQAGQPCLILKRMGPADQVTSRMYSFGLRGKQFQYVEGELPKGVKFHGRLTDNDVRKIQEAGAKVVVVESHYTEKDFQEARKACTGPSQETPAAPPPAAQPAAQPVAPATAAPGAPGATTVPPQPTAEPAAPAPAPEELSTVVLKSTPDGAEVTVDGKFVGSTPSTVRLTPGDHMIAIEKSGYKAWQRIMSVNPGGIVSVDATLERNP